jgi:hypothetical protein
MKSDFACVSWEILANMTQVNDATPKYMYPVFFKKIISLKNQFYFGTVPHSRR